MDKIFDKIEIRLEGFVMKGKGTMYNKKIDIVDIGKITLDFNNDAMMYGVQATFETLDGIQIYQTKTDELDDFGHRGERRNYNVYQNNELRQLLGLSSDSKYPHQPDELQNIKISKDCQLEVSFTNYFGNNADVNSVTFPLKDIASEEITNDLLSKKFSDVFVDNSRMVVEFVNKESAFYLKPVVERYNLDNPRKKVKEAANLTPDEKVKTQSNKMNK